MVDRGGSRSCEIRSTPWCSVQPVVRGNLLYRRHPVDVYLQLLSVEEKLSLKDKTVSHINYFSTIHLVNKLFLK